jgi:hypothetical protein
MLKYITSYGKLNERHLARIKQTISQSLLKHSQIIGIRLDLHIPVINSNNDMLDETNFAKTDASVISRFMASLKGKIKYYRRNKLKQGKRVRYTSLHYVWVREFCPTTGKRHYHVLLLLNKETFNRLGSFHEDKGILVSLIHQAWMSALGLTYPGYRQLLHIPERPCYYLKAKEGDNSEAYKALIYRTSYMAKLKSKNNTDGQRNFGCSQY